MVWAPHRVLAGPLTVKHSILYGNVTDPAGLPIENARIFLVQDSTRAKLQTWTDEQGNFAFSQLSPGVYTLQAIQTGFTPVQIHAISLAVNENRRIAIRFEIPHPEETAIIHSGEFEEASVISTHIGHDLADILPLNGNTLQPLLLLTPGVVMMANNEFSFNGQATNMNYFTVDGTNVNLAATDGSTGADLGQDVAYSALGTTSNLISLDSLDEFSVRSTTISPTIGRQSGGHVELSSRSGGDTYHGEGFGRFRNSALDAQDWFTTRRTAINTNLRQSDFGGIFSGPIPASIKWIGRNYFLVSEESLRLLQPTSLATYVPSDSLRLHAAPKLLPFLNVFPHSGRHDHGTGPTSHYRLGISNPSSEDSYAFRIDSRRNLPLEYFVRYSYSVSSRVSTDTGWSLSSAERHSQSITVGILSKLHPNIVNDLRFNIGGNTGTLKNALHRLNGATIPHDRVFLQGISPSFRKPSLNYNFLGLTYAIKSTGSNPVHQANITDSLSLQHRNHFFDVGFDYLRLVGGTVPSDYNLTVNFLSQRSIISGIADSLVIQSQDAVSVKNDILSLYAQDTWNVVPRLTIDYGIRWDLSPAPVAEGGQYLYTVTSSTNLPTMTLAPRGTDLYPTIYTNIGPRLGFSWELNRRSGTETILHGGLGWFDSLGDTYSMAPASNFPHVRQDTLYNHSYPPASTLPAPSSNRLLPPYSGQRFFAYAAGYAPPVVYQFSFGVEQHLGEGRKLSVAYVGSESSHLPIVEVLTDPNPNFVHKTTISEVRAIGTASYNSLQAQFGQKITNCSNLLASYTWAHSIDNVSQDINGFAHKVFTSVSQEYGNSDFDLRQSFGMGLTYRTQAVRFDSPMKKVLKDWSFGALFIARGSMPLNVTFARSVGSQLEPVRPDLDRNVRLLVKNRRQPWGTMLNYRAFPLPPSNRQGDLGRNSLRGHGAWQVDLSTQRDFHLKDHLSLRIRSEFFNAFNHPNFGLPDAGLGIYADGGLTRNPSFGRVTRMLSTQLGGLQQTYQVGSPRSVQASMKLIF